MYAGEKAGLKVFFLPSRIINNYYYQSWADGSKLNAALDSTYKQSEGLRATQCYFLFTFSVSNLHESEQFENNSNIFVRLLPHVTTVIAYSFDEIRAAQPRQRAERTLTQLFRYEKNSRRKC